MSARELAVWGALALAALDGIVGLFGALRWYRVAPSREFWLGVRAGQALALLYAALAGVLLLDSSRGTDAEAVHAQALDLALRRAGFRVLMLSTELGDERLERALGALDPTAIVLCGPGASTPGAMHLIRKIRGVGFDAPLFGFRATGLVGDAVPSAGVSPSQVTGMLNADLRRRAVQAFA